MSKPNSDVPIARVQHVFDYHTDGYLIWRHPTGPRAKAGDRAGYVSKTKKYRRVEIDGKSYGEHRIIWAWHTGAWPADQIDHKNGVRSDNRIENLREANNSENAQSRHTVRPDNSSGCAGVYYAARDKRWIADIYIDGKRTVVGRFADRDSAVACRIGAEKTYYTFKHA